MNRGQGSSRNDDSDEYTRLYLSASQSLSNFAQKNDIEETPEFESVEELEEKNPKYHRRHVFQQREKKVKQQPHRFKRKHPKDNTLEANLGECPSAVNLCKNYQGNWEVGNHNAGLRLIVGVVAGVSKGCSQASRSYIVGAYADINVFVVGREYGAVSAYAEYGQVSGSPLKNGIGVSLFGKSVFSKTFPYLTCQTKTYNIVDLNKDFGFTYSIVVYIVTINFSIGLSLGFTADLTYTLCVNELKANVSFIPKGEVTLRGGAEVSIVVAKAGIEISGTVSDYLDPTAYIDGNLCRVGFFMYNNLDPIQVKLQGYYQLPKLSWFKITWGDKHYLTIWQTSFSGRRDKIVDVYYGAK